MNVGSFIFDIFNRIVQLCSDLGEWITETITIGEWEVSFLGLLGGFGVTALIIYSIVKS